MKLNVAVESTPIFTHEGARATRADAFHQLKRSVLTCLLWESTFYETGSEIAARIASLVAEVKPEQVAALACEARDRMQLRHVPLFLVSELSKIKGNGALVADTLAHVIQRADELAEFVSIYWKDKKHPLSAGIKRGLAKAFSKFDEYKLAKYDRAGAIKLRDVMRLVRPKPADEAQAALWKRLKLGELATPDTWETALSGGADKRAAFERLLAEKKLGGMATLMNLRNMQQSGVDEKLIRERLESGIGRALPFRFVTAARYAPRLEDSLEKAMLKSLEGLPAFPGRTGLLVDVSGSMDGKLSAKGETTRMDAAEGLAILLREKCEWIEVATFSDKLVSVPPRHGFALRDAIKSSQAHSGTYLNNALQACGQSFAMLDRLIVITDEQSRDRVSITAGKCKFYCVNVAPYKNGVTYGGGWTHIDGWSEQVVAFIQESEALESE